MLSDGAATGCRDDFKILYHSGTAMNRSSGASSGVGRHTALTPLRMKHFRAVRCKLRGKCRSRPCYPPDDPLIRVLCE